MIGYFVLRLMSKSCMISANLSLISLIIKEVRKLTRTDRPCLAGIWVMAKNSQRNFSGIELRCVREVKTKSILKL